MEHFCRYKQRAGFVASYYIIPMALRIKELREARGWTQDDLAAKANISRSQLAQIESEARPANTLRLNSIAAAMKTTVSALFSRNELEDRLLDVVGELSADDQRTLVRMAEALATQDAASE